jgi:RNA polymerase sigma-70 factor (ECF subfamily)
VAPGGRDRLEEAARTYDPDALSRLFDQSFATIHGMLLALIGERGAAEEVARRTYERALEHLRGDRVQRHGLHAWLARTAVLEAGRRAPALEPLAGIGPRPYDPRRVRTALWRRPSEQREVLALRLLAGMDAAQVAAAGGRSLALVRSLQERALRTLAGGQRTASRGSEQALDQVLDRVIAGERPEGASAAVPEAAAQLPLVEVAWAIRTLLPISADPAARERVRESLMSDATQRRATWVHSHQGVPVRPARYRPAFRPVRLFGRFAGFVGLAIVGIVIGVILAGAAVTSEPDSFTYPLRRLAEDALVTVHTNPVSRASLEVDLSDQRLREAEAMALQGKAGLAAQAVHDRLVELRQAARALIDATGGHDAAWQAARRKLGADEVVSLQQIETQLTAHGDDWAAQRVRAENASFQSDRRFLDQELGPVPGASKAGPGTEAPQSSGGQPSALP